MKSVPLFGGSNGGASVAGTTGASSVGDSTSASSVGGSTSASSVVGATVSTVVPARALNCMRLVSASNNTKPRTIFLKFLIKVFATM